MHFEIMPSFDAALVATELLFLRTGTSYTRQLLIHYRLNDNGQMELIKNVGSLKNAYGASL